MTKQPRTSRRSVLAAIGAAPLVAAAGTGTATAESAGRVPDALRPGGELDRHLARLAAEGRFSGTVLLTHRSRTVLARSHGIADKSRSIPNGPDTVFLLGSITKVFTGIAIAQLAQDRKVLFNGKVGDYLDGFPAEVAGGVTVHHLLTMTSGLGDFHSEEYLDQARHWDTVEELWEGTMGFVRRGELRFPPGSAGLYSNAGFVVLGAIVAQVSGMSYYDYVREHVFTPAGMRASDFHTRPQWQASRRMAHPYAEQPSGERLDVLDRHLFVGLPAGGSFASAPDLVDFAHTLLDTDRLLTPEFTHLVSSPKVPISPDNSGFHGYGTVAHLRGGQWLNGHNGGTAGASCNLDWFPESGWVAVVLANYDTGGTPVGPADGIAKKIRELITGS